MREPDSARSCAVVGHTGFLGERCLGAIEARGLNVYGVSRRTEPPLSLQDPTSYSCLDRAQVVVNLSSSQEHLPLDLAAHCLKQGKTWIECASEPGLVKLMFKRFSGEPDFPGRLLLGAGIFTGLSNLLAAAAVKRIGEAEELTLILRSSPFSGCGVRTIDLMVHAFQGERLRVEAGEERWDCGVAKGAPIRTSDGRSLPTMQAPFAEPFMLHQSLGIPNLDVRFSPLPTALCYAFASIPQGLSKQRFYVSFMKLYFRLLRRGLFAFRASAVHMHVRAAGKGATIRGSMRAEDGFKTASEVVAYLVRQELMNVDLRSGCFMVDQCYELEAVLDACTPVELHWQG